MRERYRDTLRVGAPHRRKTSVFFYPRLWACSAWPLSRCFRLSVEDFFPAGGRRRVSAARTRARRHPAGSRRGSGLFTDVEEGHPAHPSAWGIPELLDNIGLPTAEQSRHGRWLHDRSADGEILVALNPKHGPTAQYVRICAEKLRREFPDMAFFFSARNRRSDLNSVFPRRSMFK